MGSPLQVLRRRFASREPSTQVVAPSDASAAGGDGSAALPPTVVVDEVLAEATSIARSDGPSAGIERLRRARPAGRYPALDALELSLRHQAFAQLPATSGRSDWPPVVDDAYPGLDGCPEIAVEDIDAGRLASAIVHHGCLLVRGLVGPADSSRHGEVIDEAFRACDTPRSDENEAWRTAWHHPFEPGPPYPAPGKGHRGWIRSAGGVLAADSPPAFAVMMEAFERAGMPDVIRDYFGEPPVLSVDKCTLRRVPLDLGGAEWHQDGSFLGTGIRTLNIWLALSPCGGTIASPGLDLVPKRFDSILATGSDGAFFDWSVGPDLVARVSQDAPVIRPEFGVGDALLFDDLFLHRTAIEPSMTAERYAIECWCFAASSYPSGATPIVF
jgi:hypothetical protein